MLINKRQGNEKGRGGWEKTLKNSKNVNQLKFNPKLVDMSPCG